jgi:hypothetical protein
VSDVEVGETLHSVRAAINDGVHSLWLVQLGSFWVVNPPDTEVQLDTCAMDWKQERDEIDRLLLDALMSHKVGYVRRAVLYDVVSDAGERASRDGVDLISAHRKVTTALADWKRELSRYVALFDNGTANHPLAMSTARLSVQEVIFARVATAANDDDRSWDGADDGCVASAGMTPPDSWRQMDRMISLHGDLTSPSIDSNPLSAIRDLGLMEYRRR